jgi:transcriptional regulator with XRE-family HTH domain
MSIDESRSTARRAAAQAVGSRDIGARLRQLRRSRNWTLQQASEQTGVALSTLSKIERGDLSPTVTTLQRIASGFGLGSASLLSERMEDIRVAGRRSITRASDGRDMPTGTCNNTWLCTSLSQKIMSPIRTRVVARSVDEYPEWARYNAEVFVYVLSGMLVVHSRIYEPTTLTAGDSMYYDASSPHAWTSEGPEDAEVLWLYADYDTSPRSGAAP